MWATIKYAVLLRIRWYFIYVFTYFIKGATAQLHLNAGDLAILNFCWRGRDSRKLIEEELLNDRAWTLVSEIRNRERSERKNEKEGAQFGISDQEALARHSRPDSVSPVGSDLYPRRGVLVCLRILCDRHSVTVASL